MSAGPSPKRWTSAWLDGAAFIVGLALAWWLHWDTTDLVWSLWLSSLVVGYAMIVWRLSEPMRELAAGLRADRSGVGAGPKTAVTALFTVGTLFALGFFTIHFGGFHFVHSVFLNQFFPIRPEPSHGLIGFGVYGEVFRRYWWFLPAAALAERQAFLRPSRDPDTSVTPAAIAARKAQGDPMMEPYKNVIRLHLLIFFFAFAHFAKLENFAVYAVVYAAYFFPWRLLRRESESAAPIAT